MHQYGYSGKLNEYCMYESADTMFEDGHANTLEIEKYTLDDVNPLEMLLVGISTRSEQFVPHTAVDPVRGFIICSFNDKNLDLNTPANRLESSDLIFQTYIQEAAVEKTCLDRLR